MAKKPKKNEPITISLHDTSMYPLEAGLQVSLYMKNTATRSIKGTAIDFDSMIHTIALQKTDNGYKLYNCSVTDLSNLKQFEEGFITGYRIYGPGRK